jgi:hypothetical protein
MGYWAPKTKYHNNAGWLIGLRTTTDTNWAGTVITGTTGRN